MTPKEFHDKFAALMKDVLTTSPCPLSQVIVELELAKAKCVSIRMQVDAENDARELATKIVPAANVKEIDFKAN